MGIIKELNSLEARKIAAGEVIERPVNIIKELVENSIDAGASQITINLKSGGLEYISIEDNGHGIHKEDIKLAFKNHATSKICCLDDLFKINSLGFRGEALSSISAVSSVKLVTKNLNETVGSEFKIGPNFEGEIKAISSPIGTKIEITNLFDNTPVRKKFQKTAETELRLIISLINNIAIIYEKISFKVNHNDRGCIILTATSIENRIQQIFNIDDSNLAKINTKKEDIEITGWFGSPEITKYNRQSIIVFVNNRFIKSNSIVKAIIRGYGITLPDKKFPIAVLNIKLDSKKIDINVHPKKEEIRFSKEAEILSLVSQAAASSVQQRSLNNLQKTPTSVSPNTYSSIRKNIEIPNTENISYQPEIGYELELQTFTSKNIGSDYKQNNNLFCENKNIDSYATNNQQKLTIEEKNDIKFLNILDNTYLLFEKPEGLLVIDQHAAHERIIYENIEKNFGNPNKISLIFSLTIKLDDMTNWFIENKEIFSSMGICFDLISDDTIALKEIPLFLKNKKVNEIFKEVAEKIISEKIYNKQEVDKQIRNLVQATIACKAAIKAGDIITKEEAEKIYKDLQNCSEGASCPHGRPTSFLYKLKDLAKEFRRYIK